MKRWIWLILVTLFLASCSQNQVDKSPDSLDIGALVLPSMTDVQVAEVSALQAKEELQAHFRPETFVEALPQDILKSFIGASSDTTANLASKIAIGDAVTIHNVLQTTEASLEQARSTIRTSEELSLKELGSSAIEPFASFEEALDFEVEQQLAAFKISAGNIYAFPVYLDGHYVGRWEVPTLSSPSTGYSAIFVLPESGQVSFPIVGKEEALAAVGITTAQEAELMLLPGKGVFWIVGTEAIDSNTGKVFRAVNEQGENVNLQETRLEPQIPQQISSKEPFTLPIQLEESQ